MFAIHRKSHRWAPSAVLGSLLALPPVLLLALLPAAGLLRAAAPPLGYVPGPGAAGPAVALGSAEDLRGDVVQVAVAADAQAMPILRALLASIEANSPNTFVHVITTAEAVPLCERLVEPRWHLARCVEWGLQASASARAQIKVVSGANTAACTGLEGCDASRAKRLSNVLNFARFYLSDILPGLDRVIWMDCDVIVQRPMDRVWQESDANPDLLLSAFVEPVRFGRFYLNGDAIKRIMERHFARLQIDLEADSFNDGVIVLNLRQWRHLKAKLALSWLMSEHRAAEPGLWKYGTQPLMMLLGSAYGWQRLSPRLYHGDLGFRCAAQGDLQEAIFLHFDGERKPWMEHGLNKELWLPYAQAADLNPNLPGP